LIFSVFLFIPSPVFAADTCCVGHGGDYTCDYSTQQLYCSDGTVSAQCTCHAAPTPTPTAMPTPTPKASPTCPANASFNENNNTCACDSGYVVSNHTCVSYGQYCRTQYGNNAVYLNGSDTCGCASGYTWNSDGTTCVTMDALCNEKLGSKSYYNSTDEMCYCYQGYAILNNQCQVMPAPLPPPATVAPTQGIRISVPTQVPIPTIAPVLIPTSSPTIVPTKKVVPTINLKKKVPGLHGFVPVKKKNNGFFADLLGTIWNAILKAFNI
jgi:hypothetical protein